MKTRSRPHALAGLVAGLLLGLPAIASAADGFGADDTTLPKQTNTHFFEIYDCGELAGVVWVTPGEAASFRMHSLRDPRVRQAAFDARAKAREQGTAFAVHGKKSGCSDA